MYLRNTHNAGGDNRGTRDFSLYSSTRAAAWARINTTTSSLERVSSQVSCDIYSMYLGLFVISRVPG